MIERIRQQVAALQPSMVAWRRHLHAHPELSFQEKATASFVAGLLKDAGIEVRTNVGRLTPDLQGTGVIAVIRGSVPGPERCFALRADLDALPIVEVGKDAYRSRNEGVMHACGHDAHTAMLLGVGMALHQLKEHWSGSVMLVFQPGEEKEPGGASLLVKEGVLSDPTPSGILGQHVTPELNVGKVGFRSGPFMAAADELYLTVKGKGGHAAMPHLLIDPVLITAHLLTSLQQIVSRRAKPGQATVLSFGKILANGATNVIPDLVEIAGTLRTFDEEWRIELHDLLPTMARNLVGSMGGELEFTLVKGSPPVVNEAGLTERFRKAAVEYLGAENVVQVEQRMGAEDFAYYGQVMPACFYRLGTGNPLKPGSTSGLHRPEFDIDEDALMLGAGMMAWAALSELAE